MTAVKEAPMRLTTSPEVVQWPEPIPSSSSESALCRTTLFMLGRSYTDSSQILRGKIRSLATSVSTKSNLRSIRAYRAGVSVAIKPGNLPSGLVYEDFRGDKYFLWPSSSQKSCSQAR
jgi:hypothetical protein